MTCLYPYKCPNRVEVSSWNDLNRGEHSYVCGCTGPMEQIKIDDIEIDEDDGLIPPFSECSCEIIDISTAEQGYWTGWVRGRADENCPLHGVTAEQARTLTEKLNDPGRPKRRLPPRHRCNFDYLAGCACDDFPTTEEENPECSSVSPPSLTERLLRAFFRLLPRIR
jgi:hypothetical protein